MWKVYGEIPEIVYRHTAFRNQSNPTNFQDIRGNTKNFCTELNIEQKFCPVGDHRGYALVERTLQTIKRRLVAMFLKENNRSIILCLSTIMRDLRWNKQKNIQVSPFQAHFGRLPKKKKKS